MTGLDTSALVALANRRDRNHRSAQAAWTGIRARRERLLVTDLVLAELAVVLQRRAGHAVAVAAMDDLMSSAQVELIAADREILEAGLALFRRYREHEISLCDCVTAASLRRRRSEHVFTFDHDFHILGFELVPASP